jgi:Ca-activated chloride channel homolog
MKSFNAAKLLCPVFFGLFLALSANAQGVIVPIICDIRPCRPIPPRPAPLPNVLPVKSVKIDTTINGQAATTRVEQIFRNDTSYTLEGTYFFPIPETASIVEFAIWENGKKLVGEVRSREEARRIYDEIVRRQRDPGLLEYAGKNLFQASIFPIPPNSDKKLELTYSQILKAESGTVAYRYPLGTGRNLWARQNPRIENVSAANAGSRQQFGTVSGKIEIVGKQALRNVYSPSHQIEINRKAEKSAVVSFETSNNDNDFQLFYGLSPDDFAMSLLTYREPAKDGYFLLTLSPKDSVAESELINKDIVFVLDTSGSMADEGKMEKARAALMFGIRGLREGDRFNVINFAGEEHLFESRLVAASADGKRRGEEFVKKLQPNGGTNINEALRAALRQFDNSDRPKMLVFLTDGLPTVGESNVEKIIKNAAEIKVENLRLFTFGVGYDVNTLLLDKLAAENGGTADYVEPKEDLEIKVSNFFTKVNSPVLTDLEMNFGSVEVDSIYPRRLPDIFKGTQVTIIGRYKNSSNIENAALRLQGRAGRENRSFNYQNLDFPLRAPENSFLPRLWAARRVGWLMEQIRTNGENKELRDEIVELGTRYGIVTPYTSFLATDGSFQSDGRSRNISSLPINGRTARKMAAPKPSAMSSVTGSLAVEASKDANKLKEETKFDAENDEILKTGLVKKIGVKTFYFENGVWIDSEFKEEAKLAEVKIKFASDEYFDLVAKEPELARFLAVGKQVAVVWKNKVYRIFE